MTSKKQKDVCHIPVDYLSLSTMYNAVVCCTIHFSLLLKTVSAGAYFTITRTFHSKHKLGTFYPSCLPINNDSS